MDATAGGSLSSILSPDGTGLSLSGKLLQKSVRSNDRLFKYGDNDLDNSIDEDTATVLRDIAAGDDRYSDNSDNFRHDTVQDINWTATIVANSIKVVSAILTILAVDNTER